MIEMLKRHEIQVLRRADHTWSEIAALSGVSEKTARRIAAEGPVTIVDNAAERARRQAGRPSKAEAYREVLVQALTENPGLRSLRVSAMSSRRFVSLWDPARLCGTLLVFGTLRNRLQNALPGQAPASAWLARSRENSHRTTTRDERKSSSPRRRRTHAAFFPPLR
jgi:hypothetical protein